MSAKQIILKKPILKRNSDFVESPKMTGTTLSLIHPSELENERKTENTEQNEQIWDELVSCIKYSPIDYSYNILLNNYSPNALTNEELIKLANGEFINTVYSPIHLIETNALPFPLPNEKTSKK